MRISVFDSRELRATIAAAKASDRAIAKEMRTQTKQVAAPVWKDELTKRTSGNTMATRAIASTARVQVTDQNVTLRAAHTKKKFSGGATAPELWAPIEFGATPHKSTYRSHSRRGRAYTVERTVATGFRPRNPTGYYVYPAAAHVIPRIAALWVQTVLRTFMETLEKDR